MTVQNAALIRHFFTITNIGALTLLGGVYWQAENLYFSWTLHFFWRLVVALFFLCSAFAIYATASRLDDAQQYIVTERVKETVDILRDIEILLGRDPEGRTVPGPDVNELLLTADGCVWLWSQGIGV